MGVTRRGRAGFVHRVRDVPKGDRAEDDSDKSVFLASHLPLGLLSSRFSEAGRSRSTGGIGPEERTSDSAGGSIR